MFRYGVTALFCTVALYACLSFNRSIYIPFATIDICLSRTFPIIKITVDILCIYQIFFSHVTTPNTHGGSSPRVQRQRPAHIRPLPRGSRLSPCGPKRLLSTCSWLKPGCRSQACGGGLGGLGKGGEWAKARIQEGWDPAQCNVVLSLL